MTPILYFLCLQDYFCKDQSIIVSVVTLCLVLKKKKLHNKETYCHLA